MVQKNVVYDDFVVELNLRNHNREEFRKIIVNTFLSENGGYWKDGIKHVTRYRYNVESANGKKIYLLRPAHLNKGMDFQVCAEDFKKFKNGKDKPPSHTDVLEDLKLKKSKDPKKFSELRELIDKVWSCKEPDDVVKNVVLNFNSGTSVEMILKILKWLFIEQDMTYWNYDGRTMLKHAIEKETR